jgi:hypothetical protein
MTGSKDTSGKRTRRENQDRFFAGLQRVYDEPEIRFAQGEARPVERAPHLDELDNPDRDS